MQKHLLANAGTSFSCYPGSSGVETDFRKLIIFNGSIGKSELVFYFIFFLNKREAIVGVVLNLCPKS